MASPVGLMLMLTLTNLCPRPLGFAMDSSHPCFYLYIDSFFCGLAGTTT